MVSSIESQLAAFQKTDKFKKLVEEAQKAARKSGKQIGGNTGVSDKDAAKVVVSSIIDELYAAFPDRIKRGTPKEVFVLSAPSVDADGNYVFDIVFDPKLIFRESLCSDFGDYGLNNIIQYFSTGAEPIKHFVAGYYGGSDWHNSLWYYIPEGYTPNAKGIAPDDFLTKTVENINARYATNRVQVKLDPKYYP